MPPNRPPHTVPLGRASLFERFPGNKLPGFYEAAFVKRALRKSFLPFLVYFSAQFGNIPALTGFCAANKVRGTSALFAAQKSVTSLAGSLDTSSGQRNKWQGLCAVERAS